jgi:tryptophanyl-tRNA synthetase
LAAGEDQIAAMKAFYLGGNYGYGHAKQALYELIVRLLKPKEKEKNTTI